MPVEYFIRYKGLFYDVGTRLKFKAYSYGYYWGIKEGVIEKFINTTVFIRGDDGVLYEYSTTKGLVDFNNIIIEIIDPVYYEIEDVVNNNRNYPSSWDVEIGWIWYIIIMIVGSIFKARLIIWIFTTAYFFLWNNGFLKGGKK